MARQQRDGAVPPMLRCARALTELVQFALDLAIVGVSLWDLITWLQTNTHRVGERGRRKRQPQVVCLLSPAQGGLPP